MTLADLIHGPRYVVTARFPLEAVPTPTPGRYYTEHGATQNLPFVQRSRNGYYATARLGVAEIRPRRQRSRGPRIAVGAPATHRAGRWLW
jgi:hypothetical protein